MEEKEELNKDEEKLLEEGIVYSKKKSVLEGLKKLEDNLPPVEPPKTSASGKKTVIWSFVILGLILLLGLGWYLSKESPQGEQKQEQESTPNYQYAFNQNFEPYPTVGLVRGNGGMDLRKSAMEAYSQEDFVKALPLFAQLTKTYSQKSFDQLQEAEKLDLFFYGVTLIGGGQVEQGIEQLAYFRNNASVLKDQAAWYMALGYLREGKIPQAKTLKEEMEEDSQYRKRLEKILDGLSALGKSRSKSLPAATPPQNFIGKVPFKGYLEESKKKVSSESFIGYVRVKGLQNPADSEDFEFMYFRDYELDANGNPVFKDLKIVEDQLYFFNMVTMRIPPEFEYVLVNNDKKDVQVYRPKSLAGKHYYGLTLLNVFPEYTADSGTRRSSDISVAEKTFIPPNYHYYTKGHNFNYDQFFKLDLQELDPGGPRGCEPTASFGKDKVPLFQFNNNTEKRLQKFNGYYLLSFGTDSTVGFCQFVDKADVKYIVSKTGILAGHPPMPGQKLGLALFDYKKYETEISDSNFGVHLVSKQEADKRPWGIGWFVPIGY